MTRLLGIDFGWRRVGLALAESSLPRPWQVLANNPRLAQRIAELCREEAIEKIILGLPEGNLAKEVKRLAQQLLQLTSIPVDFQDETLTSKEAVAKMISAGKKKKVRREQQDAFAAAVILQEYLGRPKNV